jgi:hypothetical protein
MAVNQETKGIAWASKSGEVSIDKSRQNKTVQNAISIFFLLNKKSISVLQVELTVSQRRNFETRRQTIRFGDRGSTGKDRRHVGSW